MFGKLSHAHLFAEVLPDPRYGMGDLLCWTGGVDEIPQMPRMRCRQQANDDFLLDQSRKLRNHRRPVEQRDESMESVEHRASSLCIQIGSKASFLRGRAVLILDAT